MHTNHPCFDPEARKKYARIHLPVAARCNMQCHYCSRDFSCANESRPGVCVKIISPEEALEYLTRVSTKIPNLSVVGIAGPGDPFANPAETLRTLELVKKEFPHLLLCVATNGLDLFPYVEKLAELKISHVTITVNAVNPSVGKDFYAWMRYDKRAKTGIEAADYLWLQQQKSIRALKAHDITVKINTVCIPGLNDGHMEEIARTMKDLGADLMNILPLYPVKGTFFENLEETGHTDLFMARARAGKHIEQMTHCQRCRADACGILGEDDQEAKAILASDLQSSCENTSSSTQHEKFVAVATREGILVNQHLGEADQISIFKMAFPDIPIFIRKTPAQGSGNKRWKNLAELIGDCSHLLCSGAGEKPIQILGAQGIEVVMMEGLISDALLLLHQRQSLDPLRQRSFACGSKCQGNGLGCG